MPVVDGRLDKCKRIPLERVTLIPPFLKFWFPSYTQKRQKTSAGPPVHGSFGNAHQNAAETLCKNGGDPRGFALDFYNVCPLTRPFHRR